MNIAELFVAVLNNAALILALCYLYSLIERTMTNRDPGRTAVIKGILFGSIAALQMFTPLALHDSILLDGRIITLAMAALVLGWRTALIPVVMILFTSFYLNDTGLLLTFLSSFTAYGIGLIYRWRLGNDFLKLPISTFYVMSVLLLLTAIAWRAILLPDQLPQSFELIELVIYGLVLHLVCTWLFVHSFQNEAQREHLRQSLDAERSNIHTLLDLLPLPVQVIDSQQHTRYANEAFEANWLTENIPFKDFLVDAASADGWGSIAAPGELLLERRSDPPAWFVVSERRISYEGNEAALFLYQDVSAQKEREVAMLRAEQEFRALIEHSPDLIVRLDQSGTLLYSNPSFQDVMDAADLKLLPEALREAWLPAMQAVFEDESAHNAEFIYDVHGRTTYYEIRFAPEFYHDDELVTVIGIARDISHHHALQQALRESEAKNRALFESVPDMLIYYDENQRYIDVKPAINFPLLHPVDHYPGKHTTDVLPPDVAESILERIRRALELNAVQTHEYSLEYPDQLRDFEERIVPVNNGRVMLMVRDISERKRIERDLQENESRYQLASNVGRVCVWEWDLEDGMRFVSANIKDLLGYTPEQFLDVSQDWRAHVAPEETEQAFAMMWRHINDEIDIYEREHHLRHRDGQYRSILVRAKVMRNEAGKPYRVVGTGTDINELKQVQQALVHSEQRFRALAENANDMICLHDVAGRILYATPYCEVLLKMPPEEIIGLTPDNLFHPDDLPQLKSIIDVLAQDSHNVTKATFRVMRKPGDYVWLETYVRGMHNDEGELVNFVSSSRDVTDRLKSAQQALDLAMERQKLHIIQHFISNMSHDFRNPLSIINTSLHLLEHARLDEENRKRRIENINRQVKRLDKLLDNLLIMVQLDGGEPPRMARYDLVDAVRSAVTSMESISTARGVRLEASYDAQLVWIDGNSTLLHRAICHIIENAIQYTSPGGNVQIRLMAAPDLVQIRVEDDGMGIAEEHLTQIFEVFFRADPSRPIETGGSGLGLPIAQKILNLHGGMIQVESVPEQGSAFTIMMPVAGPANRA